MSSGQEKIKEFPEDDALWFIKWIDEFRLPHLGTRSASVGVVLQKLPFTDPAQLWSIPPENLLQVFGQRSRDPHVEILPSNPRVMPGTLPLLHVGAVFQNKVKVGELPTQRQRIGLRQGELDGKEVSLGERQPAPPNWDDNFPYRLLNKFEYSIPQSRMSESRCLVIWRRHVGTYIIPRMAIFKAFYAAHSELAKAFCNGPWHERLQDVICLNDFQSGLKTERTSTGQWNVILQTLVPDSFAPILALLYFDEHARACAESIYSRSLQDRAGRQHNPWYASAQLPFRPVPLQLDVRGFQLRSWKYKDDDGTFAENRKFLVTEIVGSSWPDYIPDIGHERANSGIPSSNPTVVRAPRPYPTSGGQEASTANTQVDGEHDAQAGSTSTHMSTTEFHWINRPRTAKIRKQSSQQYEDDGRPSRPGASGDDVSTGENTHQQDGRPKGTAEALVRAPERRFENIIAVFEKLKSVGFLDSFTLLGCPTPGRLIRRGDFDCWSFIDEPSRIHGFRPRRGWRLVEYDANNATKCFYRSALVVQLVIRSTTHYWIEIECRKKNEGGFRSPVLSNVNSRVVDVINAAMETVAEKKGVSTEPALNAMLRDYGVQAACYKHVHESTDSPKFDASSVRRFLSALAPHDN